MPFFAALALSSTLAAPLPIRIDGELVHPRNLMVRASSNADLAGFRVVKRFPQIGWAVVEPTDGASKASLARLLARPGVAKATFDRAAQPAYTPNDPDWNAQWHLRTINADKAWDQSLGSSDATVAIMDTGVDMTHPDLAANIWTNPGEIPGNGIDDDNDGYVDDVHGYDFAYGDSDPTDDNSHGTGCAGIAAAVGDNGLQLSGVAPRAKIMVLKAAISSGYFYDSADIPAYIYAGDHGAKALSMSFFGDRVSPAEEDALQYALGKGVLPVAAAANDATVLPYYPAGYECVLSVAAINQDLTRAGFSDFGSWVDVAAPGTGLTTLAPGGGEMGFGGTSGACPHVAGAAALLAGAVPGASPARIRAALEDTATSLSEANIGEYTNYGLIDVNKAMTVLRSGVAAPRRSTLVRWASPIGLSDGTAAARVYGRSMDVGNLYFPTAGERLAIRGGRKRDYVDVTLSTKSNAFYAVHDGQTIATLVSPEPTGRVWPFIEGVGRGGSVLTGGYFDTLQRDRKYLSVAGANGSIQAQGTFRVLTRTSGSRTLVMRRRHSANWTGNQHVYLYDWSSASYPYGNWVEVSTTKPTSSFSEISVAVPNFGRFIDDDGTAYIHTTTDNAPNGSSLIVDCLYLK